LDTLKSDTTEHLTLIFTLLLQHYGPQHWWPGDGPFEMMVGAIMTQSTSWINVEKAILNLKNAGSLSPAAIRAMDIGQLGALIHSSGYYNVKAKKLKSLNEWLGCYHDQLAELFIKDTEDLRRELLSVYGIGEETADSILLYAAGKPVFVIDAYTRRIIGRIGIQPAGISYSDYQQLFLSNLPHDTGVFSEYHALLVQHGKTTCRKKPLCHNCCLSKICQTNFT
jgi:endonuclease III related protein